MNAPIPAVVQRYSLAEIATSIGITKQAAQKRANKEKWGCHAEGNKRFYPISALPAEVRQAIQKKAIESVVSSSALVAPVLTPAGVPPLLAPAGAFFCADLTDSQRLERDARNGVIAAIRHLQQSAGCSQESALTALLTNARSGMVEPTLNAMLLRARDGRGRKGDGYPSVRTLKRWLSTDDLAPKVRQKDMNIPAWAASFLGFYQQPQNPTVAAAYADWLRETAPADPPSIHAVRRFLDKLGAVTRERGRMGSRELKNIQPFVRRDFSLLEPNDVWTADGHCFDAEVQHPFHGRPFRPEITSIVDVATRQVVGWSIDLAESSLAVLDAIRYGVERHGIPAIFYVDNGSGYRNALMQDESTGLLGRLGITVKHSLPYNSQARGVIERSHQTLWVQAAKRLPSYIGAEMDRQARLEQFKLTRKALKKGGVMPLIPFDLFLSFIEARVVEYNAQAHRSLKGVSPNLCLRNFVTKGWRPNMVEEGIETLFRPRIKRAVRRGEINLFTNIYFSRLLKEFHGSDLHVAYDIHNPAKVWVYTPEGRFVCEAEVNGNSQHYFPVAVVDQAREKRAKGRLKNVDVKREEILAELHGSAAMPAIGSGDMVIGGRVIKARDMSAITIDISPEPAAVPREMPSQLPAFEQPTTTPRSARSPDDNYAEWLDLDQSIRNGEAVSEQNARWHQTYQNTAQFRAMSKKKAAA